MLAAGRQIERYRVLSLLGEGGMAMVYLVEHEGLGTHHALKVLTMQNRDIQRRMLAEGRVQANLRHPNIVTVTDVLDVDGKPGLLMEYIDGPPLDLWLQRYRPTLDEALAVFRGILAGVRAAHAHGLVHRDLKPANVLLHATPDGVVPKVTDFGLAKALEPQKGHQKTRTGTTLGTPAYMAPEQIRDASGVDQRADVYSLGCILYELVCGRPPYQGGDLLALFQAVAEGNFPAPDTLVPGLPVPVRDSILNALAREPAQRTPDCDSLAKGLSQYRAGLGPAVGPTLSLDQPGAHEVSAMQLQHRVGSASAATHSSANDSSATWQGSSVFPSKVPSRAPSVRSASTPGTGATASQAGTHRSTYVIAGGALVAAGVAGTAAVLLLGIGLWAWWGQSRPADAIADAASATPPLVTAPATPPATAAPGAPAPADAPATAHDEAPSPPPPATRTPEGRPRAVTTPSPRLAEPAAENKPAPRIPDNAPTVAPAPGIPKVTAGGFSFSGARRVELVDTRSGTRYSAGAPLPAGTYAIEAAFGSSTDVIQTGRATVGDGEQVVIRCSEEQFLCKQRR